MIYAMTPNPALDLSGTIDHLIPNEKNYIHSEKRFPGGNAINVARLLTRFHIPTIATGFLGKSIGEEIRDLLDKEDVRHAFVGIKGATRISLTVSNLETHQQTRFSFSGPKIDRHEIQLLRRQLERIPKSSWLIFGGSFPPGFRSSHLNSLIRAAQQRDIPVVVDIPGHLLRSVHLKGLLLIKPNLTEFHELIGRRVRSLHSVARSAQAVAQSVGLVCVSSVDDGAVLASRDFIWFGKPPKIDIKSTVGAGDSMVASMSAELWRRNIGVEKCNDDELLPDLLRHGLAAAAATLSTHGTELGNPREIAKFYSRIHVRKIRL